ncbi:amidohydrolase (plasmid) [Gemmatirosa kalamazoonensis]|uniref:Amidohydrolase n=1 Tax=Gemmatirosa kalamazoonensis TaxID=861299 RepID=W0RS12_9BACT|nr:amidohydrolase [Gemmatirosa kalamazoonensis]AHG93496.1 amidohydrolase [Gemmatirosa kalamazoonensis]
MRARLTILALALATPAAAQIPAAKLAAYKKAVAQDVDARRKFTQQMTDQIFSYGELGFQEVETSKYLVKLLRDSGFTVTEGVAGIPTAWVATWGSGKPFISLGADIDDIPQASQKPGVACREPMVPGAPGHGEGHNAGQAVNVTAALAVRALMQREHLPGTIQIWPGVAEELGGAKAYFVRAGMYKDADVVLFAHVANNMSVSYGDFPGTGNISAVFSFQGQSAHAGAAPWRGRSALDAAELMDVGWNFRREHLRPSQRSHNVIKDGGDQPNVVPATASTWYYFRELDGPHVQELFDTGMEIAQGAAMMTGTKLASVRILGSAWPGHFNRPIAEAMYENIKAVGLPKWDAADQALAKGVQREIKVPEQGLDTVLTPQQTHALTDAERTAGYSDDIGDISWNVPTVVLSYPSNIPNLPGHNWANAIAMATPIAHKGATAGAKVQAMTMLDVLGRPQLVRDAWSYFRDVQTKTIKYAPFVRPTDEPAVELNRDIMGRYRDAMRPFYYDPSKYETYLQQLGVSYPTVRRADGSCGAPTTVP